ncbi:MAG: M48 family metallopeptidase [Firmicutes bacterium]|nr:M48 family metallopeptidase [Bacillota bacterium]
MTANLRRSGFPGQLGTAVLIAVVAVCLPAGPASAQTFWDELLTGFEVSVGQSVAASIIEEYGPPARLPPARQRWIDGIFADIVAHAGRKEITYQLTVIRSDAVNAFAAPGGYVFVTTGLLSHIGDDADALANVLGHEVAHIEHKHGMNAITRQLGVSIVLDLVFGDAARKENALYTAARIAAELMRLGWSREQEHESDDLGQRLAAKAGYDPMGMVRFFQLIQRLEGHEVPFLEFLRTHPLTSERISRARNRALELSASSSG